MAGDEQPSATDRELVLVYQPAARVISRPSRRTNTGAEYRVVYEAPPGKRPALGPWCRSEERAWQAACLKLGLRLRPRG
jgi:hypothetical protein